MKKIILLLVIAVFSIEAFGQAFVVARVPENAPNVSTTRAPSGADNHRVFRGIILLKAAELVNVSTTTVIAQMSFAYSSGTNAPAGGNMKFYLQNTSDNQVTNKSANWSTAIASMLEVYNDVYNIPEGLGTPGEVTCALTQPFTYSGGNMYVAYEYVGSTYATTGASYRAITDATSNLMYASSNTTTAPENLGSLSTIRPQLLLGFDNPYNNDQRVVSLLLDRSTENKFINPGNSVTTVIHNRGKLDQVNIPVTITVTGANPYSETQIIPSLLADESASVNFSSLPTNVSGAQTITVTLAADENTSNNAKSVTQNVECGDMRYYETDLARTPLSYGAGDGIIAAKFTAPPVTPVLVKGVRVQLSPDANSAGRTVYGVLLDASGMILDESPELVIATGDVGTIKYFEFDAPVQPTAGQDFYVGMAMKATAGALPLSAYSNINVKAQPFYAISMDGAIISEVGTLGVPGLELVVDGLPVTLASSATEICAGSPITLTATSGFAYPLFEFKADNNVLSSTADVTYTYSPTAAAQLQVSGLYNGCAVPSNTIALTVNPSPTVAAITGDATVCGTASTQLANATAGGVWSSSDVNIATVDASGLVTGVTGGSVVITYSVTSGGCTGTATHNIIVNTPGSISATTGTRDICIGAATTLANPTPGGTWTSADPLIATVVNGTVTSQAVGITTITYTVSDINGCSGSAPFEVEVRALPAVPVINGAAAVCVNSQITLSSPAAGGTWTTSDAAIATVDNGGNVDGITAGPVTITYTINDGFCSASGSKALTVHPAGAVTPVTGPDEVCADAAITLSNVTAGGLWSSSNTAIATVDAAGVVNGIAAGTVTINYTYTNGNGCAATETKDITVNGLPVVPAISGSNAICIGSSATLSNAITGGTWASSDAVVATIGASSGVINGLTNGSTIITYTITDANGCVNNTPLEVTVNTSVTVPAYTGDRAVCEGSTVLLANTVSGGVWSSNNTAVATVNATTGVVSGVAPGQASITYTLTVAAGCSDAYTDIITVDAKPAVPVITGAAAVCEGGTIVLGATPAGGIWSSSSTAATVDAVGTVTGVTPGNVNIIYTVTNAQGCSNNAAYPVTVQAKPSAGNITGSSQVCEGNTITLGNSVPGGSWSSSNTAIASVGASTGVVNGITAGSVSITYTVTSAGCSNNVSVPVTVNANPATPTVTGDGAVCTGSNTTLTATIAGGTWSSSNTAAATISNTGVVNGVASGSAVITYTLTNAAGCTSATTHNIIVNALPSAGTLSGGTEVCENGTLTLSSTVAGGSWTSDNAGIATVSNGLVTGITAGSTSIFYSVSSNGCTGTADVAVTVRATPVVTGTTGTNVICAGNSATLTNNTPGGVWSSNLTGIATVSAGGEVTGVSAGDAIITYTVTNANNCSASVRHPLKVNAAPAAVTFTGGTQVCVSGSITLVPSVAGGTWNSSDPAVASVIDGVVTGNAGGQVTISYTAVNAGGCAVSGTQTVTVNALPAVATLGGANAVCVGGETTLTTSATGGVWSSSNINIAYINTAGLVSGVAAGQATIRYTIANAQGCSSTAEHTITVNNLPALTTITGGNALCAGTTLQLAHATAGGTWSSATNGVATISNSGLVTAVTAGTSRISYTVTGAGGCTAAATLDVTVNALPAVTITTKDSVCLSEGKITLTANVSGGTWSGEGVTGSEWNFANLGVGTSTLTYVYTNAAGCAATATKTIRRVNCQVIDTRPGILKSMDLVPNPATNFIKLKTIVQTGGGKWTITVTTMAGVRTINLITDLVVGANETTIDISSLPPGVYLVTLRHADKFETKTFIKVR
ncbi:Ig-like domain-containing protein [uncultured Chitinophaga sp.]|uniref:beta strand repeat-containing protein n=1 Tax=uncultured Chitinophaga sp. TaxID=339340 RepID=UPI0025CDA703|nr:Ig-like domain-containing protein [uncultured Chitinophaga sp.]